MRRRSRRDRLRQRRELRAGARYASQDAQRAAGVALVLRPLLSALLEALEAGGEVATLRDVCRWAGLPWPELLQYWEGLPAPGRRRVPGGRAGRVWRLEDLARAVAARVGELDGACIRDRAELEDDRLATPAEVRALVRMAGPTLRAVARELGVTPSTVAAWTSGRAPIPPWRLPVLTWLAVRGPLPR